MSSKYQVKSSKPKFIIKPAGHGISPAVSLNYEIINSLLKT